MPVLERALFAVGGILIFGGLLAVYAHERSLATIAHEHATRLTLMKLLVARPAAAAAEPGICVLSSWDNLLSPVPAMHWHVDLDTDQCARTARN